MSTRKRGRPSLNANNDEDELSPAKSNSAPLSAVKKRKLNTYGSKRGSNLFGTLASALGFGRSEKENVGGTEEKDELAQEEGEKDEDIWAVPDDDNDDDGNEATPKIRKREEQRATPGKGASMSHGRRMNGSAKSENIGSAKTSGKDVYEVDSTDEDASLSTRVAQTSNGKRATQRLKARVGDDDLDSDAPKRARGRPPKQLKIVSSSKKSPGTPRKRDILKKAKNLSREAAFQAMVEAGQRAAEESDGAQTTTRRRSGRSNAEVEAHEDIEDSIEGKDDAEAAVIAKGRPSKDGLEPLKDVPKGILTPTKHRALKARKSVAFEALNGIDLGFKDVPDSANKTTKSKQSRKSHESSTTTTSTKARKQVKPVGDIPQQGTELADDIACAFCKGLDSDKGNEIILCESCDFAIHLKCYGLSQVPKGDWLCRDCEPNLENDGLLATEVDGDVALGEEFDNLPEIEGLDDHLRHMQRILLDRLTGQKRIKLRGHDEEMRKVFQVVEQTVLAGEGNSMLVIGARGSGKTTLVESVISDLSTDHRENFHVVRLNGFIHTDDKLALKEIWRQLGREMDAEDEMTGKANHADTLASLLALLSHPSEISEDQANQTAKSVVFVLDEFDLFTTHPRQTLLYNLFDIAQARKAPIVVLGLTTRIDVVETLEKRVKSRFSHRYVHLSLPRSLPAFWEICKEGLLVETEDLEKEGFDDGITGEDEFVSFWRSSIEELYNNDAAFKHQLQSQFYRSKSVPAFFTSCILPIANLSARNLPLTGRKFTSSVISVSPPDSKLHIIQGLSELELSLLIAAARLDIILDTDTCNFAMAYDEYSSLTSRHKIQTSSAGVTALGSSAKVWSKVVAIGAWEQLADYELLVPAGFGGGSTRDSGAGGRMWKVDVGLEEIAGSVESLSGVMAKWCREI
ncbi:Origin recognition complex subunit 4 [Hyphodiscus hymeniophilus]|uniref:Origin recognition complex subunit 4 n=1 Tax=Hyphodiscus hymeniophilus TaxID=353542 RepID=A0A9P7AXZ1_9HELO|nr:Origin recognition complex subunit 4 [Hyphodiscus hymeniophilus]